jgi:putative Ca2+/H+ antiporter (TMEM165/GDT1 family)
MQNKTDKPAALFNAFIMIVVSEIGMLAHLPLIVAELTLTGDKTFLIAAIMATRHPRITVFLGAFASLVIMSILSAAMGRVILGLIPKVSQLLCPVQS